MLPNENQDKELKMQISTISWDLELILSVWPTFCYGLQNLLPS